MATPQHLEEEEGEEEEGGRRAPKRLEPFAELRRNGNNSSPGGSGSAPPRDKGRARKGPLRPAAPGQVSGAGRSAMGRVAAVPEVPTGGVFRRRVNAGSLQKRRRKCLENSKEKATEAPRSFEALLSKLCTG